MQEHALRMRAFQNEANYLQKSYYCKVSINLAKSRHFANSTVAIMTLSLVNMLNDLFHTLC
jgi:hypothetical protein